MYMKIKLTHSPQGINSPSEINLGKKLSFKIKNLYVSGLLSSQSESLIPHKS